MFLQIHMIKSFPASNLNRGEDGKPKMMWYGGSPRLRVSSQAHKRPIRMSDYMREGIGAERFSIRTRFLSQYVADALINMGADEPKVNAGRRAIDQQLGRSSKKERTDKEMDQERMFYFSPDEISAIAETLLRRYEDDPKLSKIEDVLKAVPSMAVDRAMFGRMSTSNAFGRVDASCQIAHWVSVHRCSTDEDFVTAVDDIDGQSHPFAGYFGAPTYYAYGNLDVGKLSNNIGDDASLCATVVANFVMAFCRANPTGAQNSYAAHVLPDYVRVEMSKTKQPVNYAPAFLVPITIESGESMAGNAIDAMGHYIDMVEDNYGIAYPSREMVNIMGRESSCSLPELAQWAAGWPNG